jgi:DNA-directed RNA polymerase subunit RPC12/RpoP
MLHKFKQTKIEGWYRCENCPTETDRVEKHTKEDCLRCRYKKDNKNRNKLGI